MAVDVLKQLYFKFNYLKRKCNVKTNIETNYFFHCDILVFLFFIVRKHYISHSKHNIITECIKYLDILVLMS